MAGREYSCGECGHRFRAPDGEVVDSRMLMCPSCGSIDLIIMVVDRPQPAVLRAREPVQSGDLWRVPESEAS